jgi:hypothetical protein
MLHTQEPTYAFQKPMELSLRSYRLLPLRIGTFDNVSARSHASYALVRANMGCLVVHLWASAGSFLVGWESPMLASWEP